MGTEVEGGRVMEHIMIAIVRSAMVHTEPCDNDQYAQKKGGFAELYEQKETTIILTPCHS